jgi:hypothetical protein
LIGLALWLTSNVKEYRDFPEEEEVVKKRFHKRRFRMVGLVNPI